MAGTALIVGVLAVVAIAGSAAVAGASATARVQQLAHAADAAALAGGDVLLGWAPGEPCVVAERLAAVHNATLARCRIEGGTVLVAVAGPVLGIRVERSARAGSPP